MSKTIETRLQSNEVRIPKKTEYDGSSAPAARPAAPPSHYFKSSFARSLSFSQSGGGSQHHNNHHNHHHLGYMVGQDHHFTRSLDFEVNYGLSTIPDHREPSGSGSSQTTPTSGSPVYDPEGEDTEKMKLVNGITDSNGGVVKTLWNYGKGSDSKTASPRATPTKGTTSGGINSGHSMATSANGTGSGSSPRKSIEANEIEVLRLRKLFQPGATSVTFIADPHLLFDRVQNATRRQLIVPHVLGSLPPSPADSGVSDVDSSSSGGQPACSDELKARLGIPLSSNNGVTTANSSSSSNPANNGQLGNPLVNGSNGLPPLNVPTSPSSGSSLPPAVTLSAAVAATQQHLQQQAQAHLPPGTFLRPNFYHHNSPPLRNIWNQRNVPRK
ncbi:mucin-12-like [Uranotaenia lowii]|uniref:mucin-12-like n=1 Tax=Uranotaenia lowii TaxID=190385 RepID=UPI00247A38D7|nr:mucin-12-like [Uranotaenia lowii]